MMRSARLPLSAAVFACAIALTAPAAAAEGPTQPNVDSSARPAGLVPLYASFAGLQMVDMHSTWRALNQGATEANPMLNGIAGNKAVLVTVKAAGTAAVIATSERLRKKSRTAAMLLMIGANSAMTWVVQHNYRAIQ